MLCADVCIFVSKILIYVDYYFPTMACSSSHLDDIKEICESLYTDSIFRLLRIRSNVPHFEDEFLDLVRQMDIHCSVQNMSKKSTDDLKFQMISEYSSIIDSQNNVNLLPVISDDLNIRNYPLSFKESDYSTQLLTARQHCMEYIEKKTNSTFPSTGDMQVKCRPISMEKVQLNQLRDNFAVQERLTSDFFSNTLKSFENELSMKKSPEICNKNFETLQSKNYNKSYESTSSVYLGKNQFHRKNSESFSGNSTKKRTTGDGEHVTRFPKKQNSSFRRNLISNCQIDTTKSFMTARSMYKNPLKKSNSKEQESESTNFDNNSESNIKNHPSLKNFDPKIIDIILSEIMDFSPDIKWSDIAGLNFVKSTVQEIVIWPLLRPDIFTGLRAPPRGILLFGPPGTGKTLIGKCIATESNSTFFCISASSLASKWVGESENLVRALFAIAQLYQPAVIFIDEIDSLLSQRSDKEQDHTRKLKTEFLVQFDGAKTNSERRILVVGATNRPHELDEAARRRFVKRLYVPLPDESARLQIIEKLLQSHEHNLSDSDFKTICIETDGYSGSDVAHLCKEAAMGPIRSIGPEQIKTVSLDQVRPIELIDFIDALKQVRASVVQEDLSYYLDWNKKFGSFPA